MILQYFPEHKKICERITWITIQANDVFCHMTGPFHDELYSFCPEESSVQNYQKCFSTKWLNCKVVRCVPDDTLVMYVRAERTTNKRHFSRLGTFWPILFLFLERMHIQICHTMLGIIKLGLNSLEQNDDAVSWQKTTFLRPTKRLSHVSTVTEMNESPGESQVWSPGTENSTGPVRFYMEI